jgi:hypothetical protein
MNRWLRVALATVVFFSVIPAFAQDASDAVGPGAQKILQLSKAGVDDSVVTSFIQSSPDPFRLSTSDIVALRAAGVSQAIVLEAMRRDTALGVGVVQKKPITESDLFRLLYGRLYYHGMVESVDSGLSPYVRSTLLSDPAAAPYINSFMSQRLASGFLSWGGLGLLVGGVVYGGVASTQSGPPGPAVNSAITLSAIGAGIVMSIFGVVTAQNAYQHLYNGLSQYNQDFIANNTTR